MKDERPSCWWCDSSDVRVVFKGYVTAECVAGCTEDHAHTEDHPEFELTCRHCGNVWDSPGEKYLPFAENVGS